MDLHLTTERHGTHAVVRVEGEVDLETASQLNNEVLAAMDDVGPRLVLDLSRVSFMDSTGLKVLIAVHRRAELAGGSLTLVGVTRPVEKVLKVTGLDAKFAIAATVGEAVGRDQEQGPHAGSA